MYELRYYQKEARDSVFNYFHNHPTGDPVVKMPTGTGKSLVIADLIKVTLKNWPDQRIMMLTHVSNLIVQNMEKLISLWPNCPLGVYSAGLKRRERMTSVVLGGVQSVARKLDKDAGAFGRINLMLIDECHLLSPKDTTQYQKVITKLKTINPHLRVIGFTATAYRSKVGSITDGGGLFDGTAYDLCSMENFNRLIDEGYISPLIPKRPNFTIDVSEIRIVRGEYDSKQVDEVVDTQQNTYKAVEEIVRCGYDRKAWLIFASSIEHANHIVGMFESFGISAAACHSKLSDTENRKIIEDFKKGHLRAVVNMNKLTTGFDFPGIDLIGMLRPTQSTVLWVQMLGRGTRPALGKENCLVLDFVGNIERLGPINDPMIPEKPKKGKKATPGEAPIKICENCGMYNHASVRRCFSCDTEFPVREKIQKEASSLELIRTANTSFTLPFEVPEVKEFDVTHINYHRHTKRGNSLSPASLRVTYFAGFLDSFSEYICFEHIGLPRRKAESWWIRRSGNAVVPKTVLEVLEKTTSLHEPKKIRVGISKTKGVHPEIVGVQF